MTATAARFAPPRLARAGLLVAPAVAAATLAAWDPARNGGPPLCPLRACTGISCPACGLTRAIGALLHGRWHEAVTLHPLAPLVLFELAAIWMLTLARRAGRARPLQGSTASALLAANAVLFLVVWAVRLGTGSIRVLG
jgi:hypothetical protein